jgi:hypothetical protein
MHLRWRKRSLSTCTYGLNASVVSAIGARQVREQHCRPFFNSFANRLAALDYALLQGFSADCRDIAGRRRSMGWDSHCACDQRSRTIAPFVNDQISCQGDIELLLPISEFASRGVGFGVLREEKFHAVAVGGRPCEQLRGEVGCPVEPARARRPDCLLQQLVTDRSILVPLAF